MKLDDIAPQLTAWLELLQRLVPLVTRMIEQLAQWGRRDKGAAYRVESFDGELVLHDRCGQSATYRKRERVRVTQDEVRTLNDVNWGNGRQFVGHRVQPGSVIGSAQVGPRVRHVIELPRVVRRGHRLSLRATRQIRGAFTRPTDRWLESEVYHHTERLTMRVLFPPGSRPRGSRVRCLLREIDTKLTARPLPGGGSVLSFTIRRPSLGERVTISWTSM
ncbi:MAG: hypothetical protein AB7I38_14720 [Dehalococcoidia bacterium]